MHTLPKTAYFQPSNAQFLKNFTVFGKNGDSPIRITFAL